MPYEVVAFCFCRQSFKFTYLFSLQFYTISDILVQISKNWICVQKISLLCGENAIFQEHEVLRKSS